MKRPHKDEAPELAGGGGFKGGHERAGNADSAAADAQRKALATLTARAALSGMRLEYGADGLVLFNPSGQPLYLVSLQAACEVVVAIEALTIEMAAQSAVLMRRAGRLQ